MEYNASDLQFLVNRYSQARSPFLPDTVRTLLIAECPPENIDRYFYFEDVPRQDSLFLEIMGVLYPDEKKQYLASGRDASLKREMLLNFAEDGYLLLYLSELPFSLLPVSLEECIPALVRRIAQHCGEDTGIILIKTSLFDLCYSELVRQGYRVSGERMPFPGSGQQKIFRTKFAAALEAL
jgi:hypothetical protein